MFFGYLVAKSAIRAPLLVDYSPVKEQVVPMGGENVESRGMVVLKGTEGIVETGIELGRQWRPAREK